MRTRNTRTGIRATAVAMLVLGTTSLPVTAQAETCDALEITATALNVRSQPAVSSSTYVGRVHNAEQYVTTGRSSGSWREIWYDSRARWVYARGYTQDVEVDCAVVRRYAAVNVRRGPSTAYSSVGTAVRDSGWALTGDRSGSWVKIWYGSEERWVSGNVVEATPPAISLTEFAINAGASITDSRFVRLNHDYDYANPVGYRAASTDTALKSESFSPWTATPGFTLPDGDGVKRVYFQLRDENGRVSNIFYDTITLKLPVVPAIPKIDRAKFFSGVRRAHGSMNQSQVDGLNYILANMEKDERPTWRDTTVWRNQMAYVLSTTKHEVANTWLPITEYSNINCPRYDGGCEYKGRGYVQLTHRYNYVKLGDRLGVNLVDFPERALQPEIAWNVMSEGMFFGLFTGVGLTRYVYAGRTDYYNARRVVNGTDAASKLRGYAETFEDILQTSIR